jgi:hypothetical protein
MEVLLLLWDELDDLTGACRHLASAAMSEVAALGAPLATAGSAVAVWVLWPQFWLNASLLAGLATLWGVYRQVLRVAAA